MSCDRIEGYQAGCDAYLPKPFNPDELVAIIENLLLRRTISNKTSSGATDIDDIARRHVKKVWRDRLRQLKLISHHANKVF